MQIADVFHLAKMILFMLTGVKKAAIIGEKRGGRMEAILSNLIVERVYAAATLFSDTGAKAKRRDRPYWGLLLKYEGETVYESDGKTVLSNARNMVILPRGCHYEWRCVQGGHYVIIEFQAQATYPNPIGIPIAGAEHVLRAFKALETKRLGKKPLTEMESIRDVYSILLELIELVQRGVPSQKAQKLAPAMEHIARNFHREVRNDELAALCGFSTVYFRKLFHEVYGVSPIAYCRSLRIRRAQEMLRSDFTAITEVALALGYPNIYDFSRDFKRHTGVSPTEYAKV